MKCDYSDILERLGQPIWWDERGVPRYVNFSPDRASLFSVDQVVLMEIACAGCGETFQVVLSSQGEALGQLAKEGKLRYGDPPVAGCCLLGPTMNSAPLQILQFWQKKNRKWIRREDLEGKLSCSWKEEIKDDFPGPDKPHSIEHLLR